MVTGQEAGVAFLKGIQLLNDNFYLVINTYFVSFLGALFSWLDLISYLARR